MKSILALSFAAASEKAKAMPFAPLHSGFSDFRLPFACVGNDRVPSVIFWVRRKCRFVVT